MSPRRWPAAAGVAAVVAAVGVVGVLSAGAHKTPDPTTVSSTAAELAPAREEVTSYTTTSGFDEATAIRLLSVQKRLPRFAVSAGRALGREYGGVWVNAHGDGRAKLGLRASSDGTYARSRHRADRLLQSFGLADEIDIVPTRYAMADLVAVQRRLEREAAQLGSAPWPIEAVAAPEADAVTVLGPALRNATPAQAAWLARVRVGFPMVHVGRLSGRPHLD